MNKKNKVDNLKKLFESSNIKLEEKKIEGFLKTFELMINEKVSKEVKPLNEKVSDYQKRNHELKSKLDEAHKYNVDIKEASDKFNKALTEKVEAINNIVIPKSDNINKIIEKKMMAIKKTFTGELNKLSSAVSKLEENINNTKDITISEDVSKIGKVFTNYKEDFVNLITEKESKEIKSLTESNNKLLERVNEQEKEIERLSDSLEAEREISEITLMVEGTHLSGDEKEYLMSLYESMDFEKSKNAIAKYIQMNELKNVKRVNSNTIMNEGTKITKKRDMGIIKEKRSDYKSAMDTWVDLAL